MANVFTDWIKQRQAQYEAPQPQSTIGPTPHHGFGRDINRAAIWLADRLSTPGTQSNLDMQDGMNTVLEFISPIDDATGMPKVGFGYGSSRVNPNANITSGAVSGITREVPLKRPSNWPVMGSEYIPRQGAGVRGDASTLFNLNKKVIAKQTANRYNPEVAQQVAKPLFDNLEAYKASSQQYPEYIRNNYNLMPHDIANGMFKRNQGYMKFWKLLQDK